jgi:hypothetical protein
VKSTTESTTLKELAYTNPSLIPFAIGVTGHRDLRADDVPALETAVCKVFDELRGSMKSTPLMLLSGLAEGADQLAARVALTCGAQLGAVLPMPAPLYRSTLDEPARAPFDALIAQASVVIDLPLGDAAEEQLAESADARAARYEALAVFLATHCHALIALWDGVPSEKKGGTAQVVRYMLEGPPGIAEEEPLAGPVYHIQIARLSHAAAPAGVAPEARLRTSLDDKNDEDASKDFEVMMRRLDAFNRDVAARVEPTGRAWDCLLPGHDDASAVSAYCQRVAQCYRAADQASLRYNELTKTTLKALLAFALLALAGFEVYAHVLPYNVALWLVYPVSLLIGWFVYRFARRREVENRYLDYRALAEALRVQFFWNLAGIPRSVSEDYLQQHRTELDWIRSALRAVSIFQAAERDRRPGGAAGIGLALEHWVEDQANWYGGKSVKQAVTLRRLDRWSGILLFAVWLVSMLIPLSLLLPFPGLAGWRLLASHEPYRGLLLLLVPLPSLAIGLFRVWVEQAGYAEQARKYNRMAHVFRRAAKRVKGDLDAGKIEEASETLRRLGMEALEENGDWLLLHRERPLKVVGAA